MPTNVHAIDRVNVYHDAAGNWHYSAWVGTEWDHNDSLSDASDEAAAVEEAKTYFPNAKVTVVAPV
jgi:hypothetical protein